MRSRIQIILCFTIAVLSVGCSQLSEREVDMVEREFSQEALMMEVLMADLPEALVSIDSRDAWNEAVSPELQDMKFHNLAVRKIGDKYGGLGLVNYDGGDRSWGHSSGNPRQKEGRTFEKRRMDYANGDGYDVYILTITEDIKGDVYEVEAEFLHPEEADATEVAR